MNPGSSIGFALGFIIGTLFAFKIEFSGLVIAVGFRGLMYTDKSIDGLIYSLFISLILCITLGMLGAKLGSMIGDVV